MANRHQFDQWVRDWTTRLPTAEILERAAALRVPTARVNDAATVLDEEQLSARGFYVTSPDGRGQVPRAHYRIDGERPPLPAPAPALGADTASPVERRDPRASADGPRLTGPRRTRPGPLDGPEGARHHVVVGRPGEHAAAGRAGRRRGARRVDRPSRSHALRRRGDVPRPRSLVGAQLLLRQHQHQQAGHHPRPRHPRRGGPRRAPHRLGRRRGGELHAAGHAQVRARVGAGPRAQPAGDHGAPARLRARRAVGRAPRLRPEHGADVRHGVPHRPRRSGAARAPRSVRPARWGPRRLRHAGGRGPTRPHR